MQQQIRITDRTSGDFGIYDVATLAADLTVYGTTPDEAARYQALQAAFENSDWNAIADLAAATGFDAELVEPAAPRELPAGPKHTELEALQLLAEARLHGLKWTAKTEAGNEYDVRPYTNPFPNWKGTDLVVFKCGKCSGNGVIGYGRVTLVKNGAEDRWCFDCGGNGKYTRRVSSLRAAFRREMARATEANKFAADWHAETAEREAAEYAAAWDEAHEEQARRAALVQGFVAEIGERFRKLPAEVVTNYQFEAQDFVTGRPITKSLMVFRFADGRLAKWVTSCRGEQPGDQVILSATVKDHDSYQGQDQTVLTRALVHVS